MDYFYPANFNTYADGGSVDIDGCCYGTAESCSSSDSHRSSGESSQYLPYMFSGGSSYSSSGSVGGYVDGSAQGFNSGMTFGSADSQVSVDDCGSDAADADSHCSIPSPPYGYTQFANNYFAGNPTGVVNSKLRNVSVSSPTPQQVSWKVAPFTQHFGTSSTVWGLQPWEQSEATMNANNTKSGRRPSCSSDAYCRNGPCCGYDENDMRRMEFNMNQGAGGRRVEVMKTGPRLQGNERVVRWTSSSMWGKPGGCAGNSFRPRPRPRLSTTCEDPHKELLHNGRDVAMDAVDVLQVRLREGAGQMAAEDVAVASGPGSAVVGGSAAVSEPLKRRLAQIRSAIRDALAEQAAMAEARGHGYNGNGSSRRRDKLRAKKCKFCLSKKEDEDIMTSHNLHDAQGQVTCPILQQYECELCHATGKKAHTLKYCPLNNPNTPHDLILQARLKVMLRNRRGQ